MIIFSKHAEQRLRERDIAQALVIEAVSDPDFLDTTRLGRTIAIKKHEKMYLKIVFVQEKHDIIIITAHWLRQFKGIL